jgi:hypothetical protein
MEGKTFTLEAKYDGGTELKIIYGNSGRSTKIIDTHTLDRPLAPKHDADFIMHVAPRLIATAQALVLERDGNFPETLDEPENQSE